MAIEEAQCAFRENEVPIGCVFVKDGQVIAKGHNKTNATGNATLHAEIVAISEALHSNGNDPSLFLQSTLYVTIEPCIMCASAIAQLGIKRAVFGASNDRFGGCGSVLSLNLDKGKVVYEVTRGVFQDKTIHLLQCFYDRENQYAPDEKRRRKNKGLLVCSLIIIRVYLKPTRQFIH
ncbi:tRNA specific adenosine deaminase [Blastocystis sp. subtype 4]|uniref:tRNA specific adenosine deaminase n=1 Tax=Blastocystis sp. subtype 4 TaxID=944170 RepID=UPI0007122821|nr:tRNA specific adenosine deaminase [Blastocystis sp. subtype 4]KNB42420.1 tRNA specific adenosine deaminase [Blastocystis sp. subtype 4]|eukprot:XP_014525863.1 tRNA specific adenosine deaminase [Blastocystis sp. subtype 4]